MYNCVVVNVLLFMCVCTRVCVCVCVCELVCTHVYVHAHLRMGPCQCHIKRALCFTNFWQSHLTLVEEEIFERCQLCKFYLWICLSCLREKYNATTFYIYNDCFASLTGTVLTKGNGSLLCFARFM